MNDSLAHRGFVASVDSEAWPSLLRAWLVVIILDIASLLSLVDRLILSLLIDPIRRMFHINDTQMSLLSGTAFALFFGFMALPFGRLADRTSRVRIISLGVLFWSLLTSACGLAKSFWQLFAARMGVGVGEASLASSAFSLLADYFPPARLPLAMSAYGVATMIGAGVGLIAGGWVVGFAMQTGATAFPFIGVLQPWQKAFVMVGLPGVLVSLLVLAIREPVRKGRLLDNSAGVALSAGQLARFMRLRWKVLLLHHLGFSLAAMYTYSIFTWSPAFLSRTYGWSPAACGTGLGTVVLLGGVSGMGCGGWLATTLMRRGVADALPRVAVSALIPLIPVSVIAPLMPTGLGALLMLGAAIFLFSVPSAIAPTALQLIAPNEMRGQLSSIFALTSVVLGLGGGPTLVALVTDFVIKDDTLIRYALASVGGVTVAGAAVLIGLWRRPYIQARKLAVAGAFLAP